MCLVYLSFAAVASPSADDTALSSGTLVAMLNVSDAYGNSAYLVDPAKFNQYLWYDIVNQTSSWLKVGF